ncbi:MAG: ribonuclease j1, ribonuclease [Candidatus Parcubacteria bacterium]
MTEQQTQAPASTGDGQRHGRRRGRRGGRGRGDGAPRSGGGRRMQRRPKSNGPRRPSARTAQEKMDVPPIGDNIRIIPLGGVEQIGQNMTALEIGDDIVVFDAGFQFKDDSTPGVDYILPNTRYLEENKHKVRALFITHGHLDHIGAIPFIIERIGSPKLYTRQFGAIMIAKRQEEFPHVKMPEIVTLDGDETIVISDRLKIESFAISHTIPDSMGLIVHTHMGDIVFIEDVRVDNIAGVPTEEEVKQYKRFQNKEALLLTMDSTSIEKSGWSLSEQVVVQNIEKIIRDVNGRLIIGTFASQVERILAIIELADKYGKKIIIEGRSMKTNLEIIKQLKLLKTDNIATLADLDHLPPDRIVMLVTGAQGEEFATLMRMANKTHKQITLRKEDTILLSSSVIPTNISAVERLKDLLYRSEAKIITYLDSDVHASGHGNREELAWIHQNIRYKYFVPLHGNHYRLRMHADLAHSLGTPREHIVVPDNGSIIEISDGGNKIEKLSMKAPNELVTVDGYSISDARDVVLRDRQTLSESGIFVIVASVNTKTGKLKKSPDIISRGFIYLRESQELLRDVRMIIRRTIERDISKSQAVDFDKLKNNVENEVTRFLFQKTAKEPIVIPVILGM